MKKCNLIRGSYHLTSLGAKPSKVRSKILMLRLKILIHSYYYYEQDDQQITDKEYDDLALELVRLQNRYPYIAQFVDYHKYFKEFDGSTGFFLPFNNPEIVSKAKEIKKNFK